MPVLQVYVDEDTRVRLARAAKELGRTVVSLAEAAIAEEALNYDKERPKPQAASADTRSGAK